jgi:hypothetical protein
MVWWWVLLVGSSIGALIAIFVIVAGISDEDFGIAFWGFLGTVVSGLLIYVSVIHLFFPAWPFGPASGSPGAASTPGPCGVHYVYDSLQNMGTSWSVQYTTSTQNNTDSAVNTTFRSTVHTTVSVTDSLGLTASGDVSLLTLITASVKTSVNASVTQSITLDVGNDAEYVVPPHSTANANYGVKVQVVGGHLYTSKDSCNQVSWGRVITYVPVSSGWCIWLNSETPCPTINSNTSQAG